MAGNKNSGRQTKLTDERFDAIMDVIRRGGNQKTACEYVGIDETTLYNWIKWGRESNDPDNVYFKFFQSYKKVRAENEMFHLDVIHKAGKDGSWQASMTYLERTRPETYARKLQIDDNTSKADDVITALKNVIQNKAAIVDDDDSDQGNAE